MCIAKNKYILVANGVDKCWGLEFDEVPCRPFLGTEKLGWKIYYDLIIVYIKSPIKLLFEEKIKEWPCFSTYILLAASEATMDQCPPLL